MDHYLPVDVITTSLLTALTEPSYIQTKALKNLLQSNPLQKLKYMDLGMVVLLKLKYYLYQIRYTTLEVQVYGFRYGYGTKKHLQGCLHLC